MGKPPNKIHMHDMVKIHKIGFEIVGGGGGIKAPLAPRPDWVRERKKSIWQIAREVYFQIQE